MFLCSIYDIICDISLYCAWFELLDRLVCPECLRFLRKIKLVPTSQLAPVNQTSYTPFPQNGHHQLSQALDGLSDSTAGVVEGMCQYPAMIGKHFSQLFPGRSTIWSTHPRGCVYQNFRFKGIVFLHIRLV